MPNYETKGSVWTYQGTDGNNTTIIGVDNIFKVDNNSLSAFVGQSVDYNSNNGLKDNSAVIDLKGNFTYGETQISCGFRLREKLGDNTNSTQLRVQPLNINKQVAKNLNLYATTYEVTKINWKNKNIEPVLGTFVGVSYNVNKVKLSTEIQYDRSLKINKNSYSINFGVAIPLTH